MTEIPRLHVGRSWAGHDLEDSCPCPQAACGLALPVGGCPEHGLEAGKTFRQMHTEEACQTMTDKNMHPGRETK